MSGNATAHPYIPNMAAGVRQEMLDYLEISAASDLYASIPEELRLRRPLQLPEPIRSEHDLRLHVEMLLRDTTSTDDYASFLGGGAWKHFVPAVCDEINTRREFLTAYAGEAYSDHGKHQAWFEWQSLMGELLDMDVVSFPTYDWMSATSSALLMATRLTGRGEVVVAETTNPERVSHMDNFCRTSLDAIRKVGFDPRTGQLDLEELRAKLSSSTAAVYVENPSFLGNLETGLEEIIAAAHEQGALCIVGVDPISLGVLAPPSKFGADLVVGDAQPLGIPLHAGGATCGFIASRDEAHIVAEYPTLLESITTTELPGSWGFGWATLERTSFDKRGLAEDFTGTTSGLWAITAAVYLSLLGREGMKEVSLAIMQKSNYAAAQIDKISGVAVRSRPHFKEFVVDFTDTGHSVAEINRELINHEIFGGHDLGIDFPSLDQSALYCVTEVTPLEHITRLVGALTEITQ